MPAFHSFVLSAFSFLSLGLIATASAHARVVDFEDLAGIVPLGGLAVPFRDFAGYTPSGGLLIEDGFRYQRTGTVTAPDTLDGSFVHALATGSPSSQTFRQVGNVPFDFDGGWFIPVPGVENLRARTLTFVGTRPDGSTVSDTFELDPAAGADVRYRFYDAGDKLTNLASLQIAGSSDFLPAEQLGQFVMDNLVINNTIPEPAGLALLAISGVALTRRRRCPSRK